MTKYPPGQRKSVRPTVGIKGSKSENPSILLLRMLLSASPFYVSGSIIAEKLKMSRVGVWARITKLREAGLIIEASQNRGYRLSAEPKRCNQSLLEALLLQAEKTKESVLMRNTDVVAITLDMLRACSKSGCLDRQQWALNLACMRLVSRIVA